VPKELMIKFICHIGRTQYTVDGLTSRYNKNQVKRKKLKLGLQLAVYQYHH